MLGRSRRCPPQHLGHYGHSGLGGLCPTVILFLSAGGVGGGGLRANNNERGSQDSESRCESTMLHKSTSSKSRADGAKDAPGQLRAYGPNP